MLSLNQLSELMRKESDGGVAFRDDVGHLDEQERWGWRRLLSSVLSAELLERDLLNPLIAAFPERTELEREIREFLRAQAADEEKHQRWIQGYLWDTFAFRREGKTLANRIFVDGFLKNALHLLKRNPSVGLALIHMYEDYSNHFYRHLKKRALERNIPGLHAMLVAIEKDELRHTSGLRMILSQIKGTDLEVNQPRRHLLRMFLQILSLDISMRKTAFYNREVRKGAQSIGVSPDLLSSGIGPAIQKTLATVR